MQQWVQDINKYVTALLNFARYKNKTIVICIDNVDQLSPEYQSQIFFLAQRISKELKSITIVALREESFYAASIRKTFTAYNIRRFHIASPCFRTLISTRLNYACQILKRPDQELKLILKSGVSIDKISINNFLAIIRESLFARNRNIVRFIECISFGNMREALDMFARFLYSGNTDVDKMLNIFSTQKRYYVGFHEFAKSVILGDKYYYRESESKVLNIFNCGAEQNSSHFTGLRLLNYLLEFSSISSPEGQGFIEIPRVLNAFINIFDNEEDFIITADRLLGKYLIETDTRNIDTIRFSNYFRVTAAGWYYFNYLSRSFAYIDLIFIDTLIK